MKIASYNIQHQNLNINKNNRNKAFAANNQASKSSYKGLTFEQALAQRSLAFSAINFTGIKEQKALLAKINAVLEKDSKREKPVIINVNQNFLKEIVRKVDEKQPVIIAVAGESASGKSTIVDNIEKINELSPHRVVTVIHCDDYYKDMKKEIEAAGGIGKLLDQGYSFDVPEAVELDLAKKHLKELKAGNSVNTPTYDFKNSRRVYNDEKTNPAPAVMIEGLFGLNPVFDDVADAKMYVHCDENTIKDRWYKRASSRNNFGETADKMYNEAVTKSKMYVRPSKNRADIVLSGEAKIDDIKLMSKEIYNILKQA